MPIKRRMSRKNYQGKFIGHKSSRLFGSFTVRTGTQWV